MGRYDGEDYGPSHHSRANARECTPIVGGRAAEGDESRADILRSSTNDGNQQTCRCYDKTGRLFGAWANCPHGWAGRLAELNSEREMLLGLLSEHSSWLNDAVDQASLNRAMREIPIDGSGAAQ